MRFGLAQLRNDIGVEQISFHSNSGSGRCLRRPRFPTKFSKRGPLLSSHSLIPGRAACCSDCHSLIGTNTAVSTPRRVTTWGPFFNVASRNSLKRAFASCTCQLAISASTALYYITSQKTSQQENIRHFGAKVSFYVWI